MNCRKASAGISPSCRAVHNIISYCGLQINITAYKSMVGSLSIDCFTVSLHSSNGRQFGCTIDCQWPFEKGRKSHNALQVMQNAMQFQALPNTQFILRQASHLRDNQPSKRPCLIPHSTALKFGMCISLYFLTVTTKWLPLNCYGCLMSERNWLCALSGFGGLW